jgi:glycine/D-amino acid oxidase-like deaminating enzyme
VDGPMGAYASEDDAAARARPFAERQGYLLLQRSEEVMRASEAGAALRRRGVGEGLRMEALSTDEVIDLEPHLAARVCAGGAWYFPDGYFLSEPAALLRALAAGFEAQGGEVRVGPSAVGISGGGSGGGVIGDDGASVLLADGSRLEANEVVIAAGAHSAALVQSVGEWCPLDTERGYHVAFASGSEAQLTRAVCDPTEGFIASPMAGGLRVAGKVELGGVDAPPTPARWDDVERATRAMIHGLGPRDKSSDWLGFRPTRPDALPVIGRSRKLPRSVFYAFGHQHVGWTLGGITGQLIAELASGAEPSIDLAPYRLGRFSLLG